MWTVIVLGAVLAGLIAYGVHRRRKRAGLRPVAVPPRTLKSAPGELMTAGPHLVQDGRVLSKWCPECGVRSIVPGKGLCEACIKRNEAMQNSAPQKAPPKDPLVPAPADPFAPSYKDRINKEDPDVLQRVILFCWCLLEAKGKAVKASSVYDTVGIDKKSSASLMKSVRVRAEALGIPPEDVCFGMSVKGDYHLIAGVQMHTFADGMERVYRRLTGQSIRPGEKPPTPVVPDPRLASAPKTMTERVRRALIALRDAPGPVTAADLGRAIGFVGDLRALGGVNRSIGFMAQKAGLDPTDCIIHYHKGDTSYWKRGSQFPGLLKAAGLE